MRRCMGECGTWGWSLSLRMSEAARREPPRLVPTEAPLIYRVIPSVRYHDTHEGYHDTHRAVGKFVGSHWENERMICGMYMLGRWSKGWTWYVIMYSGENHRSHRYSSEDLSIGQWRRDTTPSAEPYVTVYYDRGVESGNIYVLRLAWLSWLGR